MCLPSRLHCCSVVQGHILWWLGPSSNKMCVNHQAALVHLAFCEFALSSEFSLIFRQKKNLKLKMGYWFPPVFSARLILLCTRIHSQC